MPIPVTMPRQGQSVETCIITRWFKQKSDPVRAGDLLFSYETDKAAFDMESPADGTILEIFFGEGSEVPVLVNVAVIGNTGEDISAFIPAHHSGKPTGPGSEEVQTIAGPGDVDSVEPAETHAVVPGRTRISPKAKRKAKEAGIDVNLISGSGPNGRIIFSDVISYLSDEKTGKADISVPGTEYTEKPLSNVRKIIARSMLSSLQNSAQLTHHMSADVRGLLGERRKFKEAFSKGTEQDITLNDMICWCVVRALLKFPEINSHFLDDRIRTFNAVHLGVAVDTSRGLMVPSVRNAHAMDLRKLSAELRSVAESCRKGNIDPSLLQSTSASFTVSNLGSYGVEIFTPVINLPQTGILGVCTIISRPADLGNNTFGFIPYIGLSLTYDHRAIDGGPATRFLGEIKRQIEEFSL